MRNITKEIDCFCEIFNGVKKSLSHRGGKNFSVEYISDIVEKNDDCMYISCCVKYERDQSFWGDNLRSYPDGLVEPEQPSVYVKIPLKLEHFPFFLDMIQNYKSYFALNMIAENPDKYPSGES